MNREQISGLSVFASMEEENKCIERICVTSVTQFCVCQKVELNRNESLRIIADILPPIEYKWY